MFKLFWKGKNLKITIGIRTHDLQIRFVANPLTIFIITHKINVCTATCPKMFDVV